MPSVGSNPTPSAIAASGPENLGNDFGEGSRSETAFTSVKAHLRVVQPNGARRSLRWVMHSTLPGTERESQSLLCRPALDKVGGRCCVAQCSAEFSVSFTRIVRSRICGS
jgi:hypothetical protein